MLAVLLAVGGYMVFNPKLTEYIVGSVESPGRNKLVLHGQRADVSVFGSHQLEGVLARGLHQRYEIRLQSVGSSAWNCTASIEWTLPSGIFANPWRVVDERVIVDKTDIEAAAYQAGTQKMTAQLALGPECRVRLPLQARYGQPGMEVKDAWHKLWIHAPQVRVACQDDSVVNLDLKSMQSLSWTVPVALYSGLCVHFTAAAVVLSSLYLLFVLHSSQ